MKLLALAITLGFAAGTLHAQQPMTPPPGDIAPSSSDDKKVVPMEKAKRSKHALPAVPQKKPPVKPPTPETTAPDQPEIH